MDWGSKLRINTSKSWWYLTPMLPFWPLVLDCFPSHLLHPDRWTGSILKSGPKNQDKVQLSTSLHIFHEKCTKTRGSKVRNTKELQAHAIPKMKNGKVPQAESYQCCPSWCARVLQSKDSWSKGFARSIFLCKAFEHFVQSQQQSDPWCRGNDTL